MLEMLSEIEANPALAGRNFQEKIISAIAPDQLAYNGFSEFETFGSYVTARHPDSYVFREWHSLRGGGKFYTNTSQLDEQNLRWLASKYYAISLEKWSRPSRLSGIARSRLFQRIFQPDILEAGKPAILRRLFRPL